jgi:hypothetical protein
MNDWETHEVKFMPAEGLNQNETSVRVLDHDEAEEDRQDKMMERIDMLQEETSVEQLEERRKLSEKVKEDPGYKFLMMVAAFSSQRLSKIVSSDTSVKKVTECVIGCDDNASEEEWLQAPEVSGIVHLSTEVYGHLKESEAILRNGFLNVPLKVLVENQKYSQLFARLVSIRMNLSNCLASRRETLDKTFHRLHQEQSMVLRALKQRGNIYRQHDWTRPYYSQ